MPLSVSEGATLSAPTGWTWYRRPDPYYGTGYLRAGPDSLTTAESYGTAIQSLREWAQQHDIAVHADGVGHLTNHPTHRIYSRLLVNLAAPYGDMWADYQCECGTMVGISNEECPSCHVTLKCGRCNTYCVNLISVGAHQFACQFCTASCNCGRPYLYGEFHGCAECYPRIPCDHEGCERVVEVGFNHSHEGRTYCSNCWQSRCNQCGTITENRSTMRLHPITGHRICQECFNQIDLESREEYDTGADLTAQRLLIESTNERPVRICSIEQEFMGGHGNEVATSLHGLGLCASASVLDYHSSRHNYPCHVERDSSVDGGELIYNRFRLDTIEDATNLQRILSTVRSLQQNGRLVVNVRCGLHIHVDLHGYSLTDARHLAMIFNYLEDPLYRIAAARYQGHRVALAASQYAMSPPKGVWRNNHRFGQEFLLNNGHSHALNLSAYYTAMRDRCRCGVGQFGEDWSQCECEYLGKCTAEWRIFNGTTNPRKIHAYVALAQSLTAWAQQRDADAEQFPPLAFNSAIRFDRGDTETEQALMEEWKPRLEWMFSNLHFSTSEREDVMYCIRESELRYLGETYLAQLGGITRTPETRTLTVRHPAQRGAPGEQPATAAPPSNPYMNVQWSDEPDYYDDEF